MDDGSEYHVRVLTEWAPIFESDFVGTWRRAFEVSATGSPFFHPSVVRAWVESFGGLDLTRPFFVEITGPLGLWCLFPLVTYPSGWKQGWYRLMVPAGDTLFDYHDPIIAGTAESSPEIVERVWRLFMDTVLQHHGRAYDRFTYPRVRLVPGQALPLNPVPVDFSPLVRLSRYASFDEFLASRTTSFRSHLRRVTRKLEKLGKVEYVELGASDIDEAVRYVPLLVRWRRLVYPDSYNPEHYFGRLIAHGLPAGVVDFSVLKVDGVPVSFHLGLRVRNARYWYIPTYDKSFAAASPGKILLGHLVESAFEHGDHLLDFMRGGEGYKSEWTDGEQVNMIGTHFVTGGIRSALRLRLNQLSKRVAALRE